MAGFYGVKKRDFGLNTPRMALPEVQDSTSTTNQAMPDYTFEERTKKKTGKMSMQGETLDGGGKPKASWTKKMLGFFQGGKTKTAGGGRNVILESASGSYNGNASPTLHVRSVKSSDWEKPSPLTEEGVKKDPRVLLHEQLPPPFRKEEDIMTGGSSELVRLTLKPKNATTEGEARQVTLWRKPGGFGVHLSGGLPPIMVTYVEPGGEGEAAGVCVGDVVLEVNGQDCREGAAGVAMVMGLKMLIQQVKLSSREKAGSLDESSSDEEPVDDAAWQRIKAKQDDMDSKASSDEITYIDNVSETGSKEDVRKKVRKKATPQSGLEKKLDISDKEWTRMREQQELLFGKNAPSAIIHEKGKPKRKKSRSSKQSNIVHSDTMPAIASAHSGQEESLLTTPDRQTVRKELRKPSKSDYNLAIDPATKVEIDSNLRVKKSGVVIGLSSRGSSRRPSIFDQSSEGEGDDSHVTDIPTPSKVSSSVPLDLSAIPKLAPSLGLQHGHNRRDLAARSTSKRRPASTKGTLLLDTGEEERMGTQRVSLSERRRNTTPARMVRPGGARIPKSKSLEKATTTFSPTAISPEQDRSTSTPTAPTSTPTTPTSTPTTPTSTLTAATSTPTAPTSTPTAATLVKTTPTTVAPGNKRQEEKSQKDTVLHAPSVRRQDSSGSTADKVAQALAARKQQSETPEFLRRRHTLNAVSGTGGVDVLAEIRNQKEKEEKETVAQKEKEDKQTERSVPRKLFTDTEALKDELEEVKGTSPEAPVASSGEMRRTSSASRRKKSVDKPIKTLGIVSEPTDNSGGPTTRMGRRPRRQKSVEKPVKTLEIASDPEPPAWVAIAQSKHKRVSVVYAGQEPPRTDTQPSTMKEPPTSSQPSTTSTLPTSTPPTSTLPTSTPPTSTPPTTSTTTTPTTTKPDKQMESFLPKHGTVKDRLAMFQNPK